MKTQKNDYRSRLEETSEYIQWIVKDFEEEYGLNDECIKNAILEVKLKNYDVFVGFYKKCQIFYSRFSKSLCIYAYFYNIKKDKTKGKTTKCISICDISDIKIKHATLYDLRPVIETDKRINTSK